MQSTFAGRINLASLDNYAGQTVPAYITKNNAPGFAINNAKATLGRVLFYDEQLSIDNSISCGSCHKQTFAFSDTFMASKGVENGRTARHSMRLINVRFGNEAKFFWDERAAHKPRSPLKTMQRWALAAAVAVLHFPHSSASCKR